MPHFNTDIATDRDGRHHSRRKVEQPWRSWYKSPIWKSIRRHRLIEEPRCRQCAIEGCTVAASHVDHIEPHLGEWSLFSRYGNTQSLCVRHHNMHRQQETRGLLAGLDINGQPIIHNPGR
jgi:5-methylcytosine-specific restriction enzyme A